MLSALLAAPLLVAVVPAPASADTRSDYEAAQARVDSLREQADAVTARYASAYSEYEVLQGEIARVEEQITLGEARAATLHDIVQDRAVEAYKGNGVPDLTELLVGGDVLDSVRRVELLDRANEQDDEAIAQYAALTEDLGIERERLAAARDEQAGVLDSLQAEQGQLEDLLLEAQDAQEELEAQLAREEALRREAERIARERAEAAARAAAEAARVAATAAGSSGSPASYPVPSGGIICPIQGPLSFIDSWGFPRSGGRTHQGVDLMSPSGTPNVAVVPGNVTFRSGSLSGLGAYLYGDDGNTYYYFHLSGYAGGARHVAQGEVIGYTGNTGNASGGATHTHFEYHPGGGGAVNPYPIAAAAC